MTVLNSSPRQDQWWTSEQPDCDVHGPKRHRTGAEEMPYDPRFIVGMQRAEHDAHDRNRGEHQRQTKQLAAGVRSAHVKEPDLDRYVVKENRAGQCRQPIRRWMLLLTPHRKLERIEGLVPPLATNQKAHNVMRELVADAQDGGKAKERQ